MFKVAYSAIYDYCSFLFFRTRCRVLIVGGGAGGTAVGAKLCFKYGAGNVVILEPAEVFHKIF